MKAERRKGLKMKIERSIIGIGIDIALRSLLVPNKIALAKQNFKYQESIILDIKQVKFVMYLNIRYVEFLVLQDF